MDNDYNARLTFFLVENVFRFDEPETELSREVLWRPVFILYW